MTVFEKDRAGAPLRTRTRIAARKGGAVVRDRAAAVALPAAVGMAVIGAWQLYVGTSRISPLTLPGPFAVAKAMRNDAGQLAAGSWVTIQELAAGSLISMVLGFAIGAAIHLSPIAEKAMVPWMIVSQMIPLPALAPLFVIWTGFDIRPKLMLIAVVGFFPIAVNTVDGLRAADPALLDLLKTMRAGAWRRFLIAQLPAALPMIFSGLRVAATFAILGAVFGEWVGSNAGLGYLVLSYNTQLATADMLGVVVVLSAIGVALFALLNVIERLSLPWYHAGRRGAGIGGRS
jgi:ABC-type nitrate/sulfonate/bicarbonate transport system permease component